MSFLRMLRKDKRDVSDIISSAVEKVNPVYSPLVGEEPDGNAETLLDAGLEIKPVKANIHEVEFYA